MIVFGITGTIGAGKGTIVDYLVEKFGFTHYSVRSFLIEEAQKRGLPLNRDTYVELANSLRAQHCPSYITDQLYEQAMNQGTSAVIESLRTPGEIESLRKNKQFYLLAVDALPELRYERIVLRKSETDQISFQTFVENEAREMNSEDPNKQNLKKCIQMADFLLKNDQTIQDLYQQLDQVIAQIVSK